MIKRKLSELYAHLASTKTKAPADLAQNFTAVPRQAEPRLRQLITRNLLEPLGEGYAQTQEGRSDLQDHVDGRLWRFRHTYIPWIRQLSGFSGKTFLEIGCGTGTSTQALCEQGASVTGIDVDKGSLEIAEYRLRSCDLNADLQLLNARNLESHFSGRKFDAVIFFAALEHMTTDERIESLRQAWSLVQSGGWLYILEAPNRLWCFDFHTAFLPFYLWLPPDLARLYASRSERTVFADNISADSDDEKLARWGRGVSYHEFELAGIEQQALRSAVAHRSYLMAGRPFTRMVHKAGFNHKYKSLMKKFLPAHISPAFLDPFLDLALRKP